MVACVRACVRARSRACVRACVRECVSACVHGRVRACVPTCASVCRMHAAPLLLHEASYSLDEARWWCDRRDECAGFSLRVAIAPSQIAARSTEANGRAWVRFSRSRSPWYSPLAGGGLSAVGEASGWTSYVKLGGTRGVPMAGMAANVGAVRGAPLTWLAQPGFIVAPAATIEEQVATASTNPPHRASAGQRSSHHVPSHVPARAIVRPAARATADELQAGRLLIMSRSSYPRRARTDGRHLAAAPLR